MSSLMMVAVAAAVLAEGGHFVVGLHADVMGGEVLPRVRGRGSGRLIWPMKAMEYVNRSTAGGVTDAAMGLGVLQCGKAPMPQLMVDRIGVQASCAGLCYSLSVLFTTMAVARGGNAVTLAMRNAMSLVTSGAWGMLWYREVKGLAALAWCAAAALTMGSVVLLGLEK